VGDERIERRRTKEEIKKALRKMKLRKVAGIGGYR